MSDDLPQELTAWQRSREATRRIMAEMGCDPKGYPLPKDDDA
jgi:hypothetical protein